MGPPERAAQDSGNVIFPRRKQGQQKKHGRKEGVVVTMEILETVFHMPLHKACTELGVCATALKRACRKLGVKKWPYRDQQCQSQRSYSQPESTAAQRQVRAAASRENLGVNVGRAGRDSKTSGRVSSSLQAERSEQPVPAEPIAVKEEETAPAKAQSPEAPDAASRKRAVLQPSRGDGPTYYHKLKDVKEAEAFIQAARRSHDYQSDPAVMRTEDDGDDEDDDNISSSGSSASTSSSDATSSSPADFISSISPFAALSQASRPLAPSTLANRGSTAAKVSTAKPNAAPRSAVAAVAVPAVGVEPAEQSGAGAAQDSSNVIFPRRKQGQHKKHGRKEGVVVTMEILETVFHMPLHKACNALGVCATALKRACRKLGVQKWPYRDQQCQSQRSVGVSQETNERIGDARACIASQGSQLFKGARAAGGMRVGTRGASIRMGAPGTVQLEAKMLAQQDSPRKSEMNSMYSHLRASSSDCESSVDTQVAEMNHDGDGEVMGEGSEVPQTCEDVMCSLMAPGQDDEYSPLVDDDDFDSFDSEEDGLVSDELESWGLTDARLENIGALGAQGSLLLEDCLKV